MARKSMGDYLVEKGYITTEQLKQAQDMQKQSRTDLGKIFIELGFASERDVTEAKAQELGLPFVDLTRYAPEPGAVNVVPEHIAKRHNVIPVKKDSNTNTLIVAMADVNNPYAADDLRMVSRWLSERLDIPFVRRAWKPRRRGFLNAMKDLGVDPAKTVMVGDQMFTDVLGGNRAGLLTYMVRPMARREFIGTRISRVAEAVLLALFRKKGQL